MSRPVRTLLTDLLTYIGRVETASAAGKAAIFTDVLVQDAVIRRYEVIGEIVKQLPPSLLEAQPGVDWRRIKAFRDFLAHNYDRVDLYILWDAVEQLPTLRTAAEAMLASLPPEEDVL